MAFYIYMHTFTCRIRETVSSCDERMQMTRISARNYTLGSGKAWLAPRRWQPMSHSEVLAVDCASGSGEVVTMKMSYRCCTCFPHLSITKALSCMRYKFELNTIGAQKIRQAPLPETKKKKKFLNYCNFLKQIINRMRLYDLLSLQVAHCLP